MTASSLLQQGLDALKAGKVDEAIVHFEKATDFNPSDFYGFNYLGVAYAQKQLYNRAVGAFLVALRLRPGVPSVHYNLGLAYQADGLTDQARSEFQQALALDSSYQKAADALKLLDQNNQDISTMACARHTDEPAVGYCHFCHLAICSKCKTVIDGQPFCSRCAEKTGRV